MNLRVVAVGQDPYWLTGVHKATAESVDDVYILKCPGELLKCISNLPDPDADTVLLVDSSGQSEIEQVVVALRAQGWTYVIVVTADPNAKEAAAILRRNLGYDYWEKTYDENEIRYRVQACFKEITEQRKLMRKKPPTFE